MFLERQNLESWNPASSARERQVFAALKNPAAAKSVAAEMPVFSRHAARQEVSSSIRSTLAIRPDVFDDQAALLLSHDYNKIQI
jgi:hypothetical protein